MKTQDFWVPAWCRLVNNNRRFEVITILQNVGNYLPADISSTTPNTQNFRNSTVTASYLAGFRSKPQLHPRGRACMCVCTRTHTHTYTYVCLPIRDSADKSLARPGRKQLQRPNSVFIQHTPHEAPQDTS